MATPINQSVLKAFTLLRAFNAPDEWLTSSELSRRAQLPEASGYRLVQTLEGIGAIVRDSRGRYRPGMLLLALSQDITAGQLWRGASQKILDRLVAQWGGSAHVGVYEGGMVTYVAVAGRSPILPKVDTQMEAYCTAIGKVLLAALSTEAIEAFLDDGDLIALTDQTITDPAALQADLLRIREQGYAIDDCETLERLRCVATPIRNPAGQIVAAISVSGEADALTPQRQQALRAALLTAAREVGGKLYPWAVTPDVWSVPVPRRDRAGHAYSCIDDWAVANDIARIGIEARVG